MDLCSQFLKMQQNLTVRMYLLQCRRLQVTVFNSSCSHRMHTPQYVFPPLHSGDSGVMFHLVFYQTRNTLRCRYRRRALLGFSWLPSRWFSWDWPINDHCSSLWEPRMPGGNLQMHRLSLPCYHMHRKSSQSRPQSTSESHRCCFSRGSGYNVTREETSEIAAFHGLVRVVDDIF